MTDQTVTVPLPAIPSSSMRTRTKETMIDEKEVWVTITLADINMLLDESDERIRELLDALYSTKKKRMIERMFDAAIHL